MPPGWLIVFIMVPLVAAVVSPPLLVAALPELDERPALPTRLHGIASVASAVAVVGVIGAATRVDHGLWWLPGLAVWAVTLTAAATCDGAAQRIPTQLVKYGGAAAAVLLMVAGVASQDWAGLILTYAAALAAGVILGLCWRFAGLGFGDVRLAVVGGLGLGHTTYRGLAVALLVFAVVTITQAIWTQVRTHDRAAHFPYGPALALLFLAAAVW